MGIGRAVIISVALLLGFILFLQAISHFKNPEEYYRALGEPEKVNSGIPGTFEVTAIPGEPFDFITYVPGGYPAQCVAWEAEKGEASVTVSAQAKPQGVPSRTRNKPWNSYHPYALCLNSRYVKLTITSKIEQVVRVGFVLQGRSNGNGGYLKDFCRRCDPPKMQKLAERKSRVDVIADGRRKLFYSCIAGTIALLVFFGISSSIGFVYQLGRQLFPTLRATTIRNEFRRSKSGDDFDTSVTRVYEAKPKNPFRRQQDIDDINDLVNEINDETQKLRTTESQIRKERKDELARKEHAVKEYEAAVLRVEKLQEALGEKGGES